MVHRRRETARFHVRSSGHGSSRSPSDHDKRSRRSGCTRRRCLERHRRHQKRDRAALSLSSHPRRSKCHHRPCGSKRALWPHLHTGTTDFPSVAASRMHVGTINPSRDHRISQWEVSLILLFRSLLLQLVEDGARQLKRSILPEPSLRRREPDTSPTRRVQHDSGYNIFIDSPHATMRTYKEHMGKSGYTRSAAGSHVRATSMVTFQGFNADYRRCRTYRDTWRLPRSASLPLG